MGEKRVKLNQLKSRSYLIICFDGAWLYLFIALGNLVITIPLAKAYAGFGAALGTAICQIIGNVIIVNIYYHRKIKLNMKFFWKEIMKFIAALIIPNLSRNCYAVFTGFIKHCRFPNLRIIILSGIWRSDVVC